MANLFADLQTNIRKPDVIMNMGPLPSAGGLPNGFNGTTDAQINYNSTLLGDVNPYEYGPPKRLANQTAYVNVPHKIQKIVPNLRLPEAREGTQTFRLSHAIDDGDVAFALRVKRNAGTIEEMHTFERLELSNAVDPFVNLITVNYLLAGIQRNWNRLDQIKWQQFIVDTDFMPSMARARTPFTVRHALHFIQEVARPFGVVHGSERQGGQHEGGNGPVVYPVNFITSLAVSGQVQNLVNAWRDFDLSSGDDLILRLAYRPIAKPDNSVEYVLNHWRKGVTRQRFDYEEGGINGAWQLVPDVCNYYPPEEMKENYDWRQHGYWHIARTQIMKAREITTKLERSQRVQPCYYDDSRLVRGSVLDVNFEPVFVRFGFIPRFTLHPPTQRYLSRESAPPREGVSLEDAADGGGGGGGGGSGGLMHPPLPPSTDVAIGGGGGAGGAVTASRSRAAPSRRKPVVRNLTGPLVPDAVVPTPPAAHVDV